MKKNKDKQKDLQNALIKKALGYDVVETVEEFSESDDGEIVLTKKKITTKNVPPDITAIKMLIDNTCDSITDMTDDELEQERQRLLQKLNAKSKEK